MSTFSEFFLNSQSSVVRLETYEISHPNFTQTYWIVRNKTDGLTATLETSTSQFFQYLPVKSTGLGVSGNLDQKVQISLGDLGEIIPQEFDAVAAANGFGTKPVVKYRQYRSDYLTAPLLGPIILEVETFTFNKEGCTFEAKAPSLNLLKTGSLYKLDRFPTLRGFV